MTLLHLDQISGRYGAVTALHPLTLTVDGNARHAIIGPNGAGKSTLLRLISGTLPTATGRIRLAGRDITSRRPDARARAGIAQTFQHPGVITALSVRDNIRLALRARYFTGRRHNDAAVASALDRIGLLAHGHVRAGQLPYGQRRLLELGMALASQPRILLLDEPSAGLDPTDIDHLTRLLSGLPAETAVVLVDHHLPLVWATADTVTVLHHGRHLTTATPAVVRADPHVRDAYLNPPTTATTTRPRRSGTTGPVLLQVRDLRAGYHGADVLDGIDLTVRQDDVHALLGRNGAGKSTLLNTIAGLHTARAGRIQIGGIDLLSHGDRRTALPRVAIVPQGRRLFDSLSVAEHLRLAVRRRPSDQRWSLDTVLALMPSLDDAMNRPPQQLSGGQQQFLALAHALLTGPDLLLLDEPTEGLAPAVIAQLRTILAGLADTGQTVLLAEQNLGFALDVANHVTVLDRGRVVHQADASANASPLAIDALQAQLGVATPGGATA